ncbi:MAG: isopeptide-forming domain-containing fimbrial protein [Clostridiales bacterium]|nr:isopeptide-forming domain-containing fimbrial protein [Clostridiales bacterium]
MNKLRKLTCLLLALMMVFALATTAFAADTTYTITITNAQTGHTYEAYQVFAGDLTVKENGDKILSNIVWGSGVTEAGKTALGNAADKAASLKTETDAKAFAKEVAQYLQNPTVSTAGTGSYSISGLSAGYYLVKDKDNTLSDQDDFYTAYIMEVVGNVNATPKGDKPTLDKQIKHNDDGSWGVVGDNQIGDTVEFRTISTVPDTTGYETYTYWICDTMSEGLTSNVKVSSDVTIKVNDQGTPLSEAYYTVNANGNTFTIDVDILKAVADNVITTNDKLYAYYTGVLNENAKVYDDGNQDNAAHLEYSNNPNDDGKGKSPDKKVYDWTFKMGINKVDKSNTALTGAKFVLSKSGTIKVTDLACDDNGVPTVTTGLIGLVKTVDGAYRIALAGDTDIVYAIEAGNPVIKGLDDSVNYYLYETKSPAGYNLLSEPVSFRIAAEYNTDGSALSADKPTVTIGNGEPSTTLSTDVVNQSGAELPSTGGMGTTLFYVLGGVLVVGAGVLLITKKRMRSEN